LIGFKFEVGKSHQELIDIAYDSLLRNDCDLVIANDKYEMVREKNHIAYLIDKDKNVRRCEGKYEIAISILNSI
jgi:phosphopantothenate-cysteine ligase